MERDLRADDELLRAYHEMQADIALDAAPELVFTALHAIVPSMAARLDAIRAPKGEPPIPIRAEALEAANDVYANLVNWATFFATRLGIEPPAAAFAFTLTDVECRGLPSWASPEISVTLTRQVVAWLKAIKGPIWAHESAEDYWADVASQIGAARARWTPEPYVGAPRSEVFSLRPCPVCEREKVVGVSYDVEAGTVTCQCMFCGFIIPHELRRAFIRRVIS